MKRIFRVLAFFAASAMCLAASSGHATTDVSGGIADLPSIGPGEGVEGELTGAEKFGAGYVMTKSEGMFAPHERVAKSARPLRRIVKQDVYGRVLPDSFYFYRNSLKPNEQKIYDQIYANAAALDPYFEISTRLPFRQVENIFIAVRSDNPDLFWMDTRFNYTYDGNGHVTSISLKFYDDAVRNIETYKRHFYNCADSVLEYAMTLGNDVEKVKYCHDLLTNITDYTPNAYMNQSAYSTLCRGQTVCAGYSAAFQYLMQRLGIPGAVLYGETRPGYHAWNMVFLYGQYYEMDVTWNDPIGNPPNRYIYRYFNITSARMGMDHTRAQRSAALPSAYGTKYSYNAFFRNRPGSDFRPLSYGKPKRSLPPVYPDPWNGKDDEDWDFDEDEDWEDEDDDDWDEDEY